MTRTCTVCGQDKSVSEFPLNGIDKTGARRYRPDCKECYNITRKLNNRTGRRKMTKFINNTKHRTGELKSLTAADWKQCMIYFRGCCAYCGAKERRGMHLTKEHVVPVSKNGPTTRWNIVPGCPRCNSSKADKDLEDWYPKQPFYSEAKMVKIRMWMAQCLS